MAKMTQQLFDKYIDGILKFYGIIEFDELYQVFKKFYCGLEKTQFERIYKNSKFERNDVEHKGSLYVASTTTNAKQVKRFARNTSKWANIYIFNDIDKYLRYLNDNAIVDSCPSAIKMVNFLKQFNDDVDLTYRMVRDLIQQMELEYEIDNTIYDVSHNLLNHGYIINTYEQLHEYCSILYEMFENLRFKFNKGWTNKELINKGYNPKNVYTDKFEATLEFLQHAWYIDKNSNPKKPSLVVLAKIINGYVNLYGVITQNDLYERVTKFYPEYLFDSFLLDLKTIQKDTEFSESSEYNFAFKNNNAGKLTFYKSLERAQVLDEVLENNKNIQFKYHYFKTLNECIAYGTRTWALNLPQYKGLLKYIVKQYKLKDEWTKNEILTLIIQLIQCCFPPITILCYMVTCNKKTKINTFLLDSLNLAYENTRLWEYKGNTLNEMNKVYDEIESFTIWFLEFGSKKNNFEPYTLLDQLKEIDVETNIKKRIEKDLKEIIKKEYKS